MKKPLILFLFAFLLILSSASALGESRTVTLMLSKQTLCIGSEHYRRESLRYDRGLTTPVIDGVTAFKHTQTTAEASYICPVACHEDVVYLHLPREEFCLIEINGSPLTHDCAVVVPLGEDITVHVATRSCRSVFHLCLTHLAVATVDYTGYDLYANQVDGTLTVYDPDYIVHGKSSMVYSSAITFGYRGQSSLDYEKHNFSVHLKTAAGGQNKMSLLGMRKDDDWVLAGQMNDMLRLRNTVAMELWDEFYTLPWSDASGAVASEFCELIINGKYHGLYSLTEKLDRKQAELDRENGRIVRSVEAEKNGVNIMSFTDMGSNPPTRKATWYNMEIKFPKNESLKAAHWQEFYDFIRFVNESSDEAFAQSIGQYIDLENFAAYYVYITAIGATGNMNKNLYFVMENAAQSDARWLLVPWDVDGAFGRRNDASKRETDVLSTNTLFKRLIRTNAQGFCQMLHDTWNAHRDSTFSCRHIANAFTAHYERLDSEGVWQREQKTWPTFKNAYRFDAQRDYSYTLQYMESRWQFADDYFNGSAFR